MEIKKQTQIFIAVSYYFVCKYRKKLLVLGHISEDIKQLSYEMAPKLIAEIGDVRRFHNGKALTAYAGIDAPPYQSGQFTGTNRKISKRASKLLRKIGYETMRVLKTHTEPEDAVVYRFILNKENEGKSKRQAKIAVLNKFLRIYYARVSEVYKDI